MKTVRTTIYICLLVLGNAALGLGQHPGFEWANQIGEDSICVISKVVIATGHIYTAGTFYGEADFDPGPGVFSMTSAGAGDVFIAKADMGGNLIWAKQIGGTDDEGIRALAVDPAGNIYHTGIFEGISDFDPDSGVYAITCVYGFDIYVSKLDPDGNLLWAKAMGGDSYGYGEGLTLDTLGNIYVTGQFMGTVDFDPGPGVLNFSADFEDVFIAKLNPAGDLKWARQFIGTFGSSCKFIAVDNSGKILTIGEFDETVDFDPGPGTHQLISPMYRADIFISKLDTNGNFLSVVQIGDSSDERPNSVALDAAGNIYITGNFWGTTDLDPGPGTYPLTASGADIFVLKLDPNANFLWASKLDVIWLNGWVYDLPTVVDPLGNVYIAGGFEAVADMDPGPAYAYLLSEGSWDAFLTKLDPAGDFVWTRKFGGTGYDHGLGLALDAAGHLYLAGCFQDTIDVDPSSATIPMVSSGSRDGFLLKLNQTAVGIDERGNAPAWNVYPNPSPTGTFHLRTETPVEQLTLELIDLQGRRLDARTYSQVQAIQYDLLGPAGLYILRLSDAGGQSTTVRLIK